MELNLNLIPNTVQKKRDKNKMMMIFFLVIPVLVIVLIKLNNLIIFSSLSFLYNFIIYLKKKEIKGKYGDEKFDSAIRILKSK